jgi:hypothetical protein
VSGPEVHITVASGGAEGRGARGELDVSHETMLVKAALLYADRVTLASPRVAFLSSIAGVLLADEAERKDLALQLVQVLPEGAEIAARVAALRGKGGSRETSCSPSGISSCGSERPAMSWRRGLRVS